jgi:membrane-associated phospholipid phosphatase
MNTNRVSFNRSLSYCLLAIVLLGTTIFWGCGTVRNEPDGYTFIPGSSRIGRAALHAATSPLTWAPALGSAAVYFSHSDQAISDWASSHTPVFGSQKQAGTFSNYLLITAGCSAFSAMTTQVLMHNYETGEIWYPAGVTLFSSGVAIGSTGLITEFTKKESGRLRPDKADYLSFPSGHASYSTACATVASCNIDLMTLSYRYRLVWEAGTYALAAGTAWARVEAKKHYLSDVLAGWVLGHFVSQFVCEAFLGTGVESITNSVDLQLNPFPGHVSLGAGVSVPVSF